MSWPEFRRLSWYTRFAMMDELCDMLESSKPEPTESPNGHREDFDQDGDNRGASLRPKRLRK
jgi:hypothetical protein